MEAYKIPAADGTAEFVEKKSRFIGHIFRVEREEDAQAQLRALRKQYWDASHHVWAYILHSGPMRFSDDGEPGGTAGMPTLEVLRREGVSDVLCVTVRYFGGILLGAGGLTRAYARSAKLALDAVGLAEKRPFAKGVLNCPYDLLEPVRRVLPQLGAEESAADYGTQVRLEVFLPAEQWTHFSDALFDQTNGRLRPEYAGEELFARRL